MPSAPASSPIIPAVFYRDPKAALAWLEEAFGFEISLLVTDEAGNVAHAEVSWRGATISVGAEWEGPALIGPARMRSPRSLDGAGSQFIRIGVEADIDGHCRRAEAAGARITQAPADEFYGARTYRALDPEGHVWSFEQALASVSIEAMERASGLKITTYLSGETS